MMRVLLAGGGTTGHVSPLLALAECLKRRDPQTQILVLGTSSGLEARLVPEAGFELFTIPRVPMPRKPTADLLLLPRRLKAAIDACTEAIDLLEADVVVGVGGYVSAPAYLAARRRKVPIVVHEANSRPGMANRLGACFTESIACAFPGTPLKGAKVVGMPMRAAISGLDRVREAARARLALGLRPDRRTLLVTGGSLGAARLNATFADTAGELAAAGVQVLHIAGSGKADALREATRAHPDYHVVEYVDGMENAYAAADLVVCRAGAGTVGEVSAVGLPAIYVPLPIGNGEQRLNALPMVEAGAAKIFDDARFDTRVVRDTVIPLFAHASELASMSAAAARHGIRDADERLADMVAAAAASRPRRAVGPTETRRT